jgi:DNA (cytosine-5)-methyltransferase 1
VNVYRKNFTHPIFEMDLSSVDDLTVFTRFNPDMIIGGPPCQDFSSAGKRDENGDKADLTITYAQIIMRIRPRWMVMENVERITKTQVLVKTKAILQKAGYGLTEIILNASFYGVPQNRKRYFLIGELGGRNNILSPYFAKSKADKPMTVYDYLGDSLGIDHYYRHPRSYARRGVFSIYEPSPTIRGVNRPVPKTYKKHPGDTAPITPNLRPLTTIERSYIQTFPFDFVFEGVKTDLEQMIGNAVPVKLAECVGRSILAYNDDAKQGAVIGVESPSQLQLL